MHTFMDSMTRNLHMRSHTVQIWCPGFEVHLHEQLDMAVVSEISNSSGLMFRLNAYLHGQHDT